MTHLVDPREEQVRRLLEVGPHPPVPADLADTAAGLGHRLLRRRRALRLVLLLLLLVALAALLGWLVTAQPWGVGTPETTPPGYGW
ncbi:hypothetical protein [Streptomyces alkaliterrae]|uniref:ABC transporter permease n=1 Tax=Streptomyces alkaliterrae TaxID=2213162 RepID=A0A5P0Z0T3_9ACTN|nr:hypothetical protein [Streptomyces alkaliterrae]MBB1256994.1 hypothetical protein [Streptomyces alkaliterrae]MBB1261802.1 hypothetical protein [Streptomyces alkaliterrae]MQS05219.1 hypothetical protein [Streptomyces alkaliterrae]